MDLATSLDQTLQAAGIPIVGISIGRTDDRATWRVRFAPEATPEQQQAAADLLTNFNLSALNVPVTITRYQAKAALLALGRLAEIEAAIEDPAMPALAKLAWTEAQYFRRTSPVLTAFARVLRLTETDLDDLFIAAAHITV